MCVLRVRRPNAPGAALLARGRVHPLWTHRPGPWICQSVPLDSWFASNIAIKRDHPTLSVCPLGSWLVEDSQRRGLLLPDLEEGEVVS